MKEYILEIWRRRSLIYYLTVSGLKAQHRDSFIGYFWLLLDPLLSIAIYYFIVAILFRSGGSDFGMYLVIGIVFFQWGTGTINTSSKSIITRESLIKQINMPKLIFPIGASFTTLVNFSFSLIIVVIFLICSHMLPSGKILWFPFIACIQLLFFMSLGFFAAYVSVFIRDFDNILKHLLRIWFYASPVIWKEDMAISQKIGWVIKYNPMAYILRGYRNIIMYDKNPEVLILLVIGAGAVIIIGCMTYYYYNNEHKMIKVL
ncbi:MAG: ABC transporter permease [Deltaproteobacteria bacterium]|nr:ABC transporter permease [Candidatus Zymogenaceae bacterium]